MKGRTKTSTQTLRRPSSQQPVSGRGAFPDIQELDIRSAAVGNGLHDPPAIGAGVKFE